MSELFEEEAEEGIIFVKTHQHDQRAAINTNTALHFMKSLIPIHSESSNT
jgi:hypothetical protein